MLSNTSLTMILILCFSALLRAKNQCLKFEDNFSEFSLKTWKHDITLSGGGNWEFQHYTNNRTNSFVLDGKLHLYPTLTADHYGIEAYENNLSINLWGSEPANQCTGNGFYGCERGTDRGSGILINPVQSALIRSINSVSVKKGRVEVRAQLPKGDWLWPAIWLLPKDQYYGSWPASGEIDLLESRGNEPSRYNGEGRDYARSSLHWGPSYDQNRHYLTSKSVKLDDNGYHIYTLDINEDGLTTKVDGQTILDIAYTDNHLQNNENLNNATKFIKDGYWNEGQFPSYLNNPWKGRKAAPFDQEFYLIINLAVGGTNGYFPDGLGDKPWKNYQLPNNSAQKQFWDNRNKWLGSWDNGLDRAFKIDYVKVYDEC